MISGRLLIAIPALLLAPLAQAATIFSHSFGGGTSDLNGTAVDVGSGNWVAGPNFDANGDINQTSAGRGSATLAFTPVNGLIYTLDASFGALTSTGSDWVALGFAEGQSTAISSGSRFINGDVVGKAWHFNRGSGSTNDNQAFLGDSADGTDPGTNNGAAWTTYTNTYGGNMTLRIVLDTTGGAGNWTATWYADTGSGFNVVRATTTMLDESINSVGIAASNSPISGSITSFSLTSIPEPSSMALIGLSSLLLLRRRRLTPS